MEIYSHSNIFIPLFLNVATSLYGDNNVDTYFFGVTYKWCFFFLNVDTSLYRENNVDHIFRRAVKPVISYGFLLDFRDWFRYLYSNNLTLEIQFSNFFYSSENLSALYIAKRMIIII